MKVWEPAKPTAWTTTPKTNASNISWPKITKYNLRSID